MPTELLSPDEFLGRLTQCFAEPSTKGSIWLTHKRYVQGQEEKMEVDGASGSEYEVLLRCFQKDGPKYSTRIPSSSLPTFHARYGSLLKASMAPQMRKRDKKKEKAKAELFTRKRKELYVDVKLGTTAGVGAGAATGDVKGKRGAGRRQRQRKVQAQLKKEAERERVELRAEAQGGKISGV
ncbi:signal recognition particle, SRP9/SRP14 subunit [Dioszegia hungarica]|uniref:Signal recognition particle subunit SRP14 n=1 Tax=Dioszegia hungarica TaxID=4972 RepID=A0AA38HEI4_9TREE|nr:signal recognition particle, SRP9/SRP14 subunit [Dioszegia hungarica]KAI9638750.1 signal recognition particle, SRP9/SRP14 subunit [Dioszegia hungarica]